MHAQPLRSGTDRSAPGFNARLLTDRARIERHVAGGAIHIVPGGGAMILRTAHPPFEGVIENGPYLRIGLCTGPAVRLTQRIGSIELDGLWKPGSIIVTPPDRSGTTRCGAARMIGLAVAPAMIDPFGHIQTDQLDRLARDVHHDALLSSILTTMVCEADVHGAATAFFEHALAMVFRRLAELHDLPPLKRAHFPLSQTRLDRVMDLVRSRLETDISVADMATVAGMDASGFTRALRTRTGEAPYAWLTRLRMEHATRLLDRGVPVTEIASGVGYANAGKFAQAFRRVMGCSPSQWRRN